MFEKPNVKINQFLSKLLTHESPAAISVYWVRLLRASLYVDPMTDRQAGLGSAVNGSGTALTNLGTSKPSGNSMLSASCKHTS